MRMTIVTDAKGGLVAAQQGAIRAPGQFDGPGATGGLVAGPGQQLHDLDVPDTIARLQDPAAFAKQLQSHMRSVLA